MSSKPAPGSIGWIDLTVPDAPAIRDFYRRVVGWDHDEVSMGSYSDYAMKPPGDSPIAGICHAQGVNAGVPPCWLIYITVANLDESMRNALAAGGAVIHGPRDMGTHGRFCIIRDPAGAASGLFQHA
jgi:predicted enzyme related to lactoylglutathione lyase